MSGKIPLWYTQADGCEVHPVCTTCPLPQCRFDDPRAYWLWNKTHVLHGRILESSAAGKTTQTIADEAGCTLRTVYRVLAAQRG